VAAGGRPWIGWSYLAGLAATAAVRAVLDVELPVSATAGRVVLPTLGRATLDPTAGDDAALIAVNGGHAVVRTVRDRVEVPADDEQEAVGWEPVRRLHAVFGGRSFSVSFDDLDPYRNCFDVPVADRVPTGEFARWRDCFGGAYELLMRYCPAHLDEVAGGMRSIVPLADEGGRRGLSVTSYEAFGAFAASPPVDEVDLAVTIVHEFQHTKLAALMDFTRLCEESNDARFYAPWREDPRHVNGLLQGAYAFAGVADVWNSLRAAPDLAGMAELELAAVREQVRHAIGTLLESGMLTPSGNEFVRVLSTSMDALATVPLPPDAIRAAGVTSARSRARWRLRNIQPAGDAVEALADRVLRTVHAAGDPDSTLPAATDHDRWTAVVVAADAAVGADGRLIARAELVRAVLRVVAERGGRSPDVDAVAEALRVAIGQPGKP
jgi:HEXXH motif-containing protein